MSDTWKGPRELRDLLVQISELKEDPDNARAHPAENRAAVAASLQNFGQQVPVVVNKKTWTVIAGNNVLTTARELGWTHLAAVAVDEESGLSTAYAISDNRIGELGRWDVAALAEAFRKIDGDPAMLVGWDQGYINTLMGNLEEIEVTGIESNDPPPSSAPQPLVRSIVLLMEEHRYEAWEAACSKLGFKYGVTTMSDAVVAAVLEG